MFSRSANYINYTSSNGLFTRSPTYTISAQMLSSTSVLSSGPSIISYSGTIGTVTLSPKTYTFTIVGAGGGGYGTNVGGSGRRIVATYTITQTTTLQYIIGGKGASSPQTYLVGAGGGATYIYDLTNSQWLFVAGGGSGGGVTNAGNNALSTATPGSGNGGSAPSSSAGGGGGGITGDGGSSIMASGGRSYANGSLGGNQGGGFGGGGGAGQTFGDCGGGGGGYTGGNGGTANQAYPSSGGTSYSINTASVISDIIESNPSTNGYFTYL